MEAITANAPLDSSFYRTIIPAKVRGFLHSCMSASKFCLTAEFQEKQ